MIEHVPVLQKLAAGSLSNPPEQSGAFSNGYERKEEILIQISVPTL